MSGATPMLWKGRELHTVGDIMRHGIDQCDNREEAQEFMAAYRTVTEHADVNVGYLSGYYGYAEARRIRDWFGVVHPIFGNSDPSPEEAFAAGQRWAREGGRS